MENLHKQRPQNLWALFWGFSWLALQGFGGVMAVAQREIVENRRWQTKEKFLENWGVAQVLPGPNVANLAVMIGDEFFGFKGAVVALAGFFVLPLFFTLLLALAHSNLNHLPFAQGALRGMSIVVIALILANVFKLLPALKKHPVGLISSVCLIILAFSLIVIFKWSLVWVLFFVGGISCVGTALQMKKHSASNNLNEK